MKIALTLALFALALQAQDPQRIRLTVEREEGAVWKPANPALVFNAGDHLRFRVSANFAGYLYVMNHGTTGTYELLFPRNDTGSDNRIEASKDYIVPASQGWFKVSGPEGHDVIYWVVSPVNLARGERPLPQAPPFVYETPHDLRPRCDDSVFKARGECIDNSAGVRPVRPGEDLPSDLSGRVAPTPRELLFIQDKGGTVLSSQTPLAGPVIYELRLAHR